MLISGIIHIYVDNQHSYKHIKIYINNCKSDIILKLSIYVDKLYMHFQQLLHVENGVDKTIMKKWHELIVLTYS